MISSLPSLTSLACIGQRLCGSSRRCTLRRPSIDLFFLPWKTRLESCAAPRCGPLLRWLFFCAWFGTFRGRPCTSSLPCYEPLVSLLAPTIFYLAWPRPASAFRSSTLFPFGTDPASTFFLNLLRLLYQSPRHVRTSDVAVRSLPVVVCTPEPLLAPPAIHLSAPLLPFAARFLFEESGRSCWLFGTFAHVDLTWSPGFLLSGNRMLHAPIGAAHHSKLCRPSTLSLHRLSSFPILCLPFSFFCFLSIPSYDVTPCAQTIAPGVRCAISLGYA